MIWTRRGSSERQDRDHSLIWTRLARTVNARTSIRLVWPRRVNRELADLDQPDTDATRVNSERPDLDWSRVEIGALRWAVGLFRVVGGRSHAVWRRTASQ